MPKDVLTLHDELDTEIKERQAALVPLRQAMDDAIKAFDEVNNAITSLMTAKKALVLAPGVAIAIEERANK